MPRTRPDCRHRLSQLGVPLYWPMIAALRMVEQELGLLGKKKSSRNLREAWPAIARWIAEQQ
jgi:hypothetical protein